MKNMVNVLNPTKFKFIMAAVLFIPTVTVILILLGFIIFPTQSPLYPFYSQTSVALITVICLAAIFICYVLASSIDHLISNRNLKIVIAVTSGLISLLILYLFYKMIAEPVVCDPVHTPQNHTVCDPVHQHGQGNIYTLDILKDIDVDAEHVKNSYQHCLDNLANLENFKP